jgi:signal peptidase I
MRLDKERDINQRSFNGDRILVNKFAYQFHEPRRWDVIVFKYPGNAKVNYIKRLVGLPGETLKIEHGDVHILDPATGESSRQQFRIERKPPDTVLAMLQLVDDSRFAARRLTEAGWPSRWTPASPDGWNQSRVGEYSLANRPSTSWLRYRHLVPRHDCWRKVGDQERVHLEDNYQGHLITDYYAYNDSPPPYDSNGECWVGDLAVECDVEIQSGVGELLLDLVEGGVRFRCAIATSSGQAKLSIDNGYRPFTDSAGHSVVHPAASTAVRGTGRHRLRFANVDDQLHLWVDDELALFDGPTTYQALGNVSPKWSEQDPADLQPIGIAGRGLGLQVSRLRVLRDVYYRAVEPGGDSEYGSRNDIDAVMSTPQDWETTDLFAGRRSVTFHLGPDQFFPLGDNSPESKDARLWSTRDRLHGGLDPPPYVERDLLIGRALAIYWPHGWRVQSDRLGLIPNFQRIGLIR